MEHKTDSQGNQAERIDDQPNDQATNNQALNINPKNSKNQKIRFGLLALFVGASLLILGRSLIDDSIGKPTPFVFPERIEFAQVQTQSSAAKSPETIPETIVDNKDFYGKPKYLSGKSYKYLIDDRSIDVALRYAVGTDGDLFLYLKELGNIEINEDELRQKIVRNSIGYYAAFEYQNRAYLTACINPRGISTVTKEQYEDNASDRATDRDVVIGWLLGQKDLRDRRCLWTLMSTPITPASDRNATNQKLEKTWILWYEWWKLRFPQP